MTERPWKQDAGKLGMVPFTIREIQPHDLGSGFIDVLRNLTQVGDLDESKALEILHLMNQNPLHKVFVAVSESGRVLGATTLLIERKFIHGGRSVAHIEDVVVAKGMEKKGIGKALMMHAIEVASKSNCYKCILDCNNNARGFYQRLGFAERGTEMRLDFP